MMKHNIKTIIGIMNGFFLLGAVLWMASFSCMVSHAKDSLQENAKEVVIVLDCSKSMEDVDGQYLAFDFIKGLSAAMPRNCKIGAVAYNDEVCAFLPLGSSYAIIDDELEKLEYKRYGNAGAGMEMAVGMFGNGAAQKQIILISDGEIMMDSEEATTESANSFAQAIQEAKGKSIAVDVLAIGKRIEEGATVYAAAEDTGGNLYEIGNGEELGGFIEKYLFENWRINQSHVGKLNGMSGELTVKLPDCLMETAQIILLGKQQNENLAVTCEADRINVLKGRNYTTIELLHPNAEEIKIRTFADTAMDIDAYLMAEYDFSITAGHAFEAGSREGRNQKDEIQETEMQEAEIWLEVVNKEGKNLLDGHLGNGGMEIYLDGRKQEYTISDGKARIRENYSQDSIAKLEVRFPSSHGSYYGESEVEERIVVPIIEEEPERIDWFFWCIMTVFVIAITAIFYIAYKRRATSGYKKKIIDNSRVLPKESGRRRNDFCGKIVVYIIHNKDDIDYPPESINLFARCNREMITLEWILDACNIPLDLKGADRIIIKPEEDRSLAIKNSSKASALMGRELLIKGRTYHLYYHEKITFIFEQEDAEIEIHYKDLKPNER